MIWLLRKFFGSEKNKDILLDFLNDVLVKNEQEKIIDITFLNTVQQPEIAIQKQSIIDVLCVDNLGVQYIVEMQVAKSDLSRVFRTKDHAIFCIFSYSTGDK